MKTKKDRGPKQKNAAIEAFKHSREKGVMMYRLFAVVVDFVIISILYQLAVVIFGAPDVTAYLEMQELVQGLTKEAPEVIARMKLWQECYIAFLAIGAGYEALFLIPFGASLGKLIFGFRVVSANEERSVLVQKLLLLLRSVVKMLSIYLLSAIPFIFLSLTTFGNAEARSGFDMFAGTKVLYKRMVNK